MVRKKLLVVGNGMASLRFLEELMAISPEQFSITVVGGEPDPAYNRVLLSPLLAGEITAGDVAMKPRSWYAENEISLISGVDVKSLNSRMRTARLSNGQSLAFDICVLATGSEPIRLDMPGAKLDGVEVFRALSDLPRITAAAARGAGAVVIGGGLLGIEAAYGLKRAGAPVTLVHVMDRLMERQLDATGGALLKSALESKGIDVCLNAASERIEGRGAAAALILKDGSRIPASAIVMAVGVKPRIDLASSAALNCRRGFIVNDRMETSISNIYAIGECAEHRGSVYGLVEPAYEHARVAARAICGHDDAYDGTVLATNLKVSGVPVFSAGDFLGGGSELITWHDEASASYRKFVVKDEKLTGVVLVGDTADALWYRDLIRAGKRITPFRQTLAFGRAYAEAA